MKIKTPHLMIEVFPDLAAYRLKSLLDENQAFTARFNTTVEVDGKAIQLLPQNGVAPIKTTAEPEPAILSGQQTLDLTYLTNLSDVTLEISLAVWDAYPLAGIKMTIINSSSKPLGIQRITPLQLSAENLTLPQADQAEWGFFSNGWQSWSTSGVYGAEDRQRRSILGPFQEPMVINPGTPRPHKPGHFSSDMFGVIGDRRSRLGLLAGFLSQKAHFGSLEAWLTPQPALQLWANGDSCLLPPGEICSTDWAVFGFINLDAPHPLQPYLDAVAHVHHIHPQPDVPVGWCSWYHFYENVTAENIRENLAAIVKAQPETPLPNLQIDDGFESRPGDWFSFDPQFPEGVQPLAAEIKSAGIRPGLWLAPFIVHPKAKIIQEHPDWLLRNKNGRPVTAGFVWNSFTRALDLTHPDALAYACEVVRKAAHDWGYPYLKLDFLYAAALDGEYQNPEKTRAQVLREGLEALREAVGPDVTLLGCGCPLGSGLGIFEIMRIGADVSSYWQPHFPPFSLLLKNEPHMPSARNALQNILTRAPLHQQWWVNDPDCLLVRPETDLTLAEIQSLATAIALTGGSLLISDDLPALSPERMKILQALLPLIGQRPQVLDWFDAHTPQRLRLDLDGAAGKWHLLGLFNWQDQPQKPTFDPAKFRLPQGQSWWLRSFWDSQIQRVKPGHPLILGEIPAHGACAIAIRQYQPDQPCYLGSNLHISQGLEVQSFDFDPKKQTLSMTLHLGHDARGSIFLYLPWQPDSVQVDQQAVQLTALGKGVFNLPVKLQQQSTTKISIA